MNLLFCVPNTVDFEEVFQYMNVLPTQEGEVLATSFLAHQVDVLITGETAEKTAKNIEKTLSMKRYHLALFAGFSQSWKETIPVGTIVNVIREKSADNADFSNKNNSYLNIFFELKKVFSAPKEIAEKADVLSQNGIALVSQCVRANQPFYQLRAIDENLATNEINHEVAKKNLNQTLISILAVI